MSNKRWFTADNHFGHQLMADLRGFKNVSKMDNHLIDIWNNTLDRSDVVYVLGDFFWTYCNEQVLALIKYLNGNKVWVKGNHDRWIKKSNVHFRRIKHAKIERNYFVMCHYPLWTWNRKDYGAIHLHGHSHGNTSPRINMLDVGVDNAKLMLGEYRPFSLEEVLYLTQTTKPKGRY